MPDFSHLKKYAVTTETTATFVFTRIEGDPSVILRPAHEVNEDYLRARLAANLKLAETLAKTASGPTTPDDMIRQGADERETDRRLLSQTCATGWGVPPKDSKGKDVEFTPENAYEFFKAIPPEMFDPCRNFAGNLYNFYPERQFKENDGAALGNSLPGA